MPILIKRYANRKLYNTQSSRYITLKGIAQLLNEGKEVRVIDNETGEDITSVALSQILVDSNRSNSKTPTSLLSQIMEHGGDALYDAFKRSVDDASGGIGEMQERFRRIINPDTGASEREGESHPDAREREKSPRSRFVNWIAYASPDLESAIENSVERVFKLLDLPRRRDVEALNRNMERVVELVEKLEQSMSATRPPERPAPAPQAAPTPPPPVSAPESAPAQD